MVYFSFIHFYFAEIVLQLKCDTYVSPPMLGLTEGEE